MILDSTSLSNTVGGQDMKYLIANLKAHHSFEELRTWMHEFVAGYHPHEGWTVGIAASFPHLSFVAEKITGLQGCAAVAQAVSSESAGSFTGEVYAGALRGIVSHCIVGHSERRKRGESTQQIQHQIQRLTEAGIEPILCIGTQAEYIDGYQGVLAYEPPQLIGTGTSAHLDDVLDLKNSLPSFNGPFLYGASVDEHTCAQFLGSPEVDGMLVGTASVDPKQFLAIVAQL